jgi:hypothetical protein
VTLSLLEERLLRLEQILYGSTAPPTDQPAQPVATSLAELERRFSQLLRHFRVYSEILQICMSLRLARPVEGYASRGSSANTT